MSVTRSGCGSVFKKSLYNMAKSRITCREGDGCRWEHGEGCAGPKKTAEREREGLEGACGRGGGEESQEEGWEGSGDGWRQDRGFKREGSAPGHPWVLGRAEPGALGALQEVGTGPGTGGGGLSTHPVGVQGAG